MEKNTKLKISKYYVSRYKKVKKKKLFLYFLAELTDSENNIISLKKLISIKKIISRNLFLFLFLKKIYWNYKPCSFILELL